MKSATVVLGAAALALLAAACDVKVNDQGNIDLGISQGRASDTWKRSYMIPKGGLLEISNPLGRIQAEPATGTEVEVVAEREVRANSDEAAQAGMKTLTMLESVTPDSVRIEAKVERPEGFSGRVGVSVRYSVRVPPGVRVSFKNETGETIVTGLSSGVTIAATTGPVRGRDLSGPVDAATVNGPVELSFVAVNADVRAQTVNGGVDVRLPADANAEIEARAINGGVRLDDGLKLQAAQRERTSLRGTLNAGGPTVSMAVTNGGVFIGPRGAGTQPAERGPERRER
jgi:hypothetical protein